MNRPWSRLAFGVVVALVASAPRAQSGGGYTVAKSTIDAGGGVVTAGPYSLRSTTGQPDAHYSEGSGYALRGGFWGAPSHSTGDRIFANGFD